MVAKEANFRKIDINLIDRPDEIVRLAISDDEIKELATSMKEKGLLQPIILTPVKGRYMIVAGDRRFLAADVLGWKKIMSHVKEMSADDVALIRAIENIQRKDLTPFEEARVYKGLITKRKMSIEDISKRIGKSPGVIQRRLDILEMPESFQKALHLKQITTSVAEELWHCQDNARREYFLELAIEHGITQRIARDWVTDYNKSLRTKVEGDVERGRLVAPFQSAPSYRGCDTCHGPVTYDDLKQLLVCPGCFELILEALRQFDKQSKESSMQKSGPSGTA